MHYANPFSSDVSSSTVQSQCHVLVLNRVCSVFSTATVYLLKFVAGFAPEMLVSRPGLGLETVQDHFLVVLVLVSIGPVLVLVLVSNTGSKKVLVGLGHFMHGQALKGAFNNHCQSVEGLV
jgi:hypothetical protein